MSSLRPTDSASPAAGVLRGLRAGVLAVLGVLLPVAGHVLSRSHCPGWVVVAATAAVAVPGAVLLTRRRLSDAQVLGVLVAAQLAHHAAYSLPGACAAVTARGAEACGVLSWPVGHDTAAGAPTGVLLAGHLMSVLLAARLLGVTERLLWQGRPLLAAVRRVLLFVRPLFGRVHGTGPRVTVRESAAPLRSAVLVRLIEGRGPPRGGVRPLALFRPLPIGGPRLP
ncbi:hypothetical protein ABZ568_41810 [Streptomyces olindensis]|uniref:Integral membrane protein n=1 Tax=Streptomyces olindensis TaxID=358823 RepID=A0ABV2Y9Z9_9ACTN